MGNVRPSYIKNLVYRLLDKHSGEWSTDFEENKKKVELFTNIESKKIRNRVAGYITRKMRPRSAKQ
jgi:small subunit ribosomal protein S17e